MNHKRRFCLWINPSPGLTHTTCSCATQLCNPAPSQPSPTKVTESQQCSSHCMQDVQRKGNKTLSTSPGQSALCTRDGSALRTERELYLQLCVVCFASEHTTAGYDCREKAFLQQRLLLPAALRHSPELQGLERDRCSSSPCWDTCAAGRAPFCTHAPPKHPDLTLTAPCTHSPSVLQTSTGPFCHPEAQHSHTDVPPITSRLPGAPTPTATATQGSKERPGRASLLSPQLTSFHLSGPLLTPIPHPSHRIPAESSAPPPTHVTAGIASPALCSLPDTFTLPDVLSCQRAQLARCVLHRRAPGEQH